MKVEKQTAHPAKLAATRLTGDSKVRLRGLTVARRAAVGIIVCELFNVIY